MKVTVKYFARLREVAGREKEDVDLGDGDGTTGGLLRHLGAAQGDLGEFFTARPVLLAVNGEYADEKKKLADGDEVALFPPVSGG